MTTENTRTQLRDVWTFRYSTGQVLEAAKQRVAHHTEKLKEWTEKRTALQEKLKSEGIDFEAMVQAGISNTQMYNQQRPTLDEGLLRQHSEAQERVVYHAGLEATMRGWVKVLSAPGIADSLLDLTINDIQFFHLDDEQ